MSHRSWVTGARRAAAFTTAAFALLAGVPAAFAASPAIQLDVREARTYYVHDPLNGKELLDGAGQHVGWHEGDPVDPASRIDWLIVRDETGDPYFGLDATKTDPATGLLSLDWSANTASNNPGRFTTGTVAGNCFPNLGPGNHADNYAHYPENCPWPSLKSIGPGTTRDAQLKTTPASAALVQTSGTAVGPMEAPVLPSLPDGKFFISIQVKDLDGNITYEVSGSSITVKGGVVKVNGVAANTTTGNAIVPIFAQRNPLPTSTVRIDVFSDMNLTNGEYDRGNIEPPSSNEPWGRMTGGETGVNGYKATITDITGEAVQTDAYGNQICSDYEPILGADGKPVLDDNGLTIYQLFTANGDLPLYSSYDADGNLHAAGATTLDDWVGAAPHLIPGSGGICTSKTYLLVDPTLGTATNRYESSGHIVVRNLEPGRHTVTVTPPTNLTKNTDPNHPHFSQTTTLEGGHDFDTWVVAGDNGLDHEFMQGSEKVSQTFSGWVTETDLSGASKDTSANGGTVHGFVHESWSYAAPPANPANGAVPLGGTGNYIGQNEYSLQKDGGAVKKLWVALVDATTNATVYAHPFFADDSIERNVDGLGAGEFNITNVAAGDYVLVTWDQEQNNILHTQNITVSKGETKEMDTIRLAQWWSKVSGYVYDDVNGNGKRDAGEHGIPHYTLTIRSRDNTLFEQGNTLAITNADGYYEFRATYPLGQWQILEAYDDGHKNTGITWKGLNANDAVTWPGGAVDVNFMPWIGQAITVDWGKQTYSANENGGIVGAVTYGTTRNETNADEALAEDWQPGIPGMTVHLFQALHCTGVGTAGIPQPDGSVVPTTVDVASCAKAGEVARNAAGAVRIITWGLDSGYPASAAHKTGTGVDVSDPYVTETWQAPVDCTANDAEGSRMSLPFMADYLGFMSGLPALDPNAITNLTDHHACAEGISSGAKLGVIPAYDPATGGASNGAANWTDNGATVNGNYGFGDRFTDPNLPVDETTNPMVALPADDYVVKVDIPKAADGSPVYQLTKEEDINVFSGDAFTTPQVLRQGCAGPNHTVDVRAANPAQDGQGVAWAKNDPLSPYDAPTTDGTHVPATFNPTFAESNPPYEGQSVPLCNAKLVHLENGKSVAPGFEFFTAVPMPGIHYGLIIDDMNVTTDANELFYGDKAPTQNLPVTWYDFSGRQVQSTITDRNGYYEVMLPSTNRINAPTPSGVSPAMYQMMANDPSKADQANLMHAVDLTSPILHPADASDARAAAIAAATWRPRLANERYNHNYRTLATPFQLYPGVQYITDLALWQANVTVQAPTAQSTHPAQCLLDADATPQLFLSTKVYTPTKNPGDTDGPNDVTLTGQGFGASGTVGLVLASTPDAVELSAAIKTWAADKISFTVPTGTPAGAYQVRVTNGVSKEHSVNTITLHVTGATYSPTIYDVGPGSAPRAALGGTVTGSSLATLGSPATTIDLTSGAYTATANATFGLPTHTTTYTATFNTNGPAGPRFDLTAGQLPGVGTGLVSASYSLTGARIAVYPLNGTITPAVGTGIPATTYAAASVAAGTTSRTRLTVTGSTAGLLGGTTYRINLPNVAAVPSSQSIAATNSGWFVTSGLSAQVSRRSGTLGANTSLFEPVLQTYYVLDPSATSLHPQPAGTNNPWPNASTAYTYIPTTGNLTVATGTIAGNQAGRTLTWTTAATGDTGTATITSNTAIAVTFPIGSNRPPLSGSALQIAVPAVPPVAATVTVSLPAGASVAADQLAGANLVAGAFNETIVSNAASSNGTTVLTFTNATINLPANNTDYTLTGDPNKVGLASGLQFNTSPKTPVVSGTVSGSGTTLDVDVTLDPNALRGAILTLGNGQLRVVRSNTANQVTIESQFGNGNGNVNASFTTRKATIQDAINYGAGLTRTVASANNINDLNPRSGNVLLAVRPGEATEYNSHVVDSFNPTGVYHENLIIPNVTKLQGFGAGGEFTSGSRNGETVNGTVIDGGGYGLNAGGAYRSAWIDLANYWLRQTRNNSALAEGPVVSVLTGRRSGLDATHRAAIDGLTVQGGDALAWPGTLNQLGGGNLAGQLVQYTELGIQGGGIYAPENAHYLQVTNNLIEDNNGYWGAGIRVGTPFINLGRNRTVGNDNIRIANNQITGNGGAQLAGGIGIFQGADSYRISRNEICGNYSAEYGGGISHFGRSPGGKIDLNRVYLNQSYEDGAGIQIAGETPDIKQVATANIEMQASRTTGAGDVTIDGNVIQSNLSLNNGGGIRFLMAGLDKQTVQNNIIANNLAGHTGAGIAIQDTPDVRIINDTIVKNITTASAMTSDGNSAPAGISESTNNEWLTSPTNPNGCSNTPFSIARIASGAANWPNCIPPGVGNAHATIVNSIIVDNRAGYYDGSSIRGIGLSGDSSALNTWDVGSLDSSNLLQPVSSTLTFLTDTAATTSTTDPVNDVHGNYSGNGNVAAAANVAGVDGAITGLAVTPYNTGVLLAQFRGDPHYVAGTIVVLDTPSAWRVGNYKLTTNVSSKLATGLAAFCIPNTLVGFPATGVCSPTSTAATSPATDVDEELRGTTPDIGADQYTSGIVSVFAQRRPTGRTLFSARIRPAKAAKAGKGGVVGALAPFGSRPCTGGCTATLQVRATKGSHHAKSYRMTSSHGSYRITRQLKNGTYKVRVVYRNRVNHSVHASAWRTITIRKGAR